MAGRKGIQGNEGCFGTATGVSFYQKSIEAHVCNCFAAYKCYKEPERILKNNGIKLSVDKVLNIAKTITTVRVKLQQSNEIIAKTMLLTDRHKSIAKLFETDFWHKNLVQVSCRQSQEYEII